jgi:hypothetical protein
VYDSEWLNASSSAIQSAIEQGAPSSPGYLFAIFQASNATGAGVGTNGGPGSNNTTGAATPTNGTATPANSSSPTDVPQNDGSLNTASQTVLAMYVWLLCWYACSDPHSFSTMLSVVVGCIGALL